MDLATEALARIPAPRLKQLTNGQNVSGAAAVNATVLGLAVADAEADFLLHAEIAFDGALPTHIAVGVRGVVAYLKSYIGQDDEGKVVGAFQKQLVMIRNTGPRGRVDPYTTSPFLHDEEPVDDDGVARPLFGDARFRDLVPRPMGNDTGVDDFRRSDD